MKNSSSLNRKILNEHVLIINKNNNKRTLIFIPGGPGLSFDYLPSYFEYLSEKFQLVFYNPGFESNFEYISLESLASELNHLAQRFSDQSLGFVSHSGGSLILLEYFKRYGEAPAVFMSGVTDKRWLEIYKNNNPNSTVASQRLQRTLEKVGDPHEALRMRMIAFLDDYFPAKSREKGMQEFVQMRYFPSVAIAIEKEINSQNLLLRTQFTCGRAPFLVVGGSDDKVVFPEYLKDMCRERQNHHESLLLVPGAGHFGFIDKTDDYNSYLFNFFNKHLVIKER